MLSSIRQAPIKEPSSPSVWTRVVIEALTLMNNATLTVLRTARGRRRRRGSSEAVYISYERIREKELVSSRKVYDYLLNSANIACIACILYNQI